MRINFSLLIIFCSLTVACQWRFLIYISPQFSFYFSKKKSLPVAFQRNNTLLLTNHRQMKKKRKENTAANISENCTTNTYNECNYFEFVSIKTRKLRSFFFFYKKKPFNSIERKASKATYVHCSKP